MAVKYAVFWLLPLVSAATWLGMLLAMFIVWELEGSPHYVSMASNQNIAYISDIGAQGLKPLFIGGCCVTTIFLDLAFMSEKWLRHTGRLAKTTTRAEKILSGLSIIFAIAGTCGLILLSIFDTVHHPHLHDGFLLLFMGGYVISAIFICAEYQRLGIHFRQHRILRASFWMKLFFILVEFFLAIAFAVCTFDHRPNVGAVLEWTISLIFTFYVLTFLVDLFPAWHARQVESNAEMGAVNGTDGTAGPDYSRNGYAGAYEAQDQRAIPQAVPEPRSDFSHGDQSEYGTANGTMSSGYSHTNGGVGRGYSNVDGALDRRPVDESSGQDGTLIEHAGAGFSRVESARNY